MGGYRIDFWRSVPNEDGQSHEVCEARIAVEASGADEARKRAEAIFCEERGVEAWSERADRVAVEGEAAEAAARLDEPWRNVDT